MTTPVTAPRIPEPEITYLEGDHWRLERELLVVTRGSLLVVPAGFTTDLASIPRALWTVIAPFELSCVAPIVHDWLYQHGGRIETRHATLRLMRTFSRADADAFLLDLMEQEAVSVWRRWSAYHAVRLFGASSWQAPTPPTPPAFTPWVA